MSFDAETRGAPIGAPLTDCFPGGIYPAVVYVGWRSGTPRCRGYIRY